MILVLFENINEILFLNFLYKDVILLFWIFINIEGGIKVKVCKKFIEFKVFEEVFMLLNKN